MKYPLVALTGYARTGKDEVGNVLIKAGFTRVCFGDLIKSQVDSLIQKHLGFSAFTEKTEEKAKIRRTLENWGEDNYDNIFAEFFGNLTPPAVNTRLCRLPEATAWVKRGGILVNVTRPNVGPETPWSGKINQDLQRSGLITFNLENNGTLSDLRGQVKRLLL